MTTFKAGQLVAAKAESAILWSSSDFFARLISSNFWLGEVGLVLDDFTFEQNTNERVFVLTKSGSGWIHCGHLKIL